MQRKYLFIGGGVLAFLLLLATCDGTDQPSLVQQSAPVAVQPGSSAPVVVNTPPASSGFMDGFMGGLVGGMIGNSLGGSSRPSVVEKRTTIIAPPPRQPSTGPAPEAPKPVTPPAATTAPKPSGTFSGAINSFRGTSGSSSFRSSGGSSFRSFGGRR